MTGPAAEPGVPATNQPDSIQGHGFLLGVDPVSTVVEVVSANVATLLGIDAERALGRPLAEVLGAAAADILTGRSAETGPMVVRLPPAARASPTHPGREPWNEFEVTVHSRASVRLLEFEPVIDDVLALGSIEEGFSRALDHLRAADGIAELCAVAAAEIRQLTGYDRVLAYRFPTPATVELIARSVVDHADPGPPRPTGALPHDWALSSSTRVRQVVDTGEDPVGLLAASGAPTAVDLGLRTVGLSSPGAAVRQHLRDVGIAAVLTVSLVLDGRLWGVLVCEHRAPRRVSSRVRGSCEMLGRVLSLQLRAAQAQRESEHAFHLEGLAAEVVTALSLADSLAAAVAEIPEAVLGMVAADGVVVQVEGRQICAGRVPDAADIGPLLRRVTALADGVLPLWETDALPWAPPAAGSDSEPMSSLATGILYLPFGEREEEGCALWLRGEQDPPGLGRSRPWLPAERSAARIFAAALPALLTHRVQRDLITRELAVSVDLLSAAAERQESEHQLHQHQRLESLGQLAGGIAHDFNNLLAIILNYVEFIGDEIDSEARTAGGDRWHQVQEDVVQAKAAMGRAAELTRQLLAFARREVVQLQAIDLNTVISGLENLLRRTIGDNITLRTELADPLHLVLVDPGQVEQIVVNLAVNARDAMSGGGTLTIETANVDAPDRLPAVRLRVGDTGTGIPREIADRIFEPFFTTKAPGDGTGLGLATVHGIVQRVGGTISIDSEVGRGTSFTVVIPATDVAPAETERATTVRPAGGGETVLIVEDGDDLRELTRRLLHTSGYHVLTAASGEDAVRAATESVDPVDLLLTDLMMPLMTGDEVAVRIRQLWPEVRVVLMSGYAMPAMLANGDGSGLDHPLLDKPFTRSTLLAKVREVLDTSPESVDGR